LPDETLAGGQLFTDFVQIGAVVRDLDQSVKVLSEVFGIGPWRIVSWPPEGRTDMNRVYHGRPAEFTARMAFAELGSIELELIQPQAGESIWADFLTELGPDSIISASMCRRWNLWSPISPVTTSTSLRWLRASAQAQAGPTSLRSI